jgi:hypothetical protein
MMMVTDDNDSIVYSFVLTVVVNVLIVVVNIFLLICLELLWLIHIACLFY